MSLFTKLPSSLSTVTLYPMVAVFDLQTLMTGKSRYSFLSLSVNYNLKVASELAVRDQLCMLQPYALI